VVIRDCGHASCCEWRGKEGPMAKKGMHHHDAWDPNVSRGPSTPAQSTPITTGSVKKQETYREQALHHEATDRPGQLAKNEWKPDTRDKPPLATPTRAS